jgi:hypothetical protein
MQYKYGPETMKEKEIRLASNIQRKNTILTILMILVVSAGICVAIPVTLFKSEGWGFSTLILTFILVLFLYSKTSPR